MASSLIVFGKQLWRRLPSSHHVLVALLFFFGLEFIFALQRGVILSLITLLGLMTVGLAFIAYEEGNNFHFTQAILPSLAAVGLTAFALFVPSSALLHLYFLAASLTFYFLLQFGARLAYPTWNWGLSAVVLYVDIAAVLGWHFHLTTSLLVMLLLAWLTIFLLSWQALWRIPNGEGEALLLALAVSFTATELIWVLQFTPWHFLIQAGVVLVFYYILFQMLTASFAGGLRRRDVLEYTVVGSIALIVLLTWARWL